MLSEDVRQLNHTMTSLTDKAIQTLLQQECQSGDSDQYSNPCLIRCQGHVATQLKYYFCAWSTDIKPKLASLIVNMDVLVQEQVCFLNLRSQLINNRNN